MNKSREYDLVIVGAGIVGLAAASQLAGQFSKVLVLERSAQPESCTGSGEFGLRVSAVNLATVELLASIGVWQEIADTRTFPFRSMRVWDQKYDGELQFHASDSRHMQLGFIVENDLLRDVLLQHCSRTANIEIIYDCSPTELTQFSEGVLLETSQGDRVMTKLVLATDGRRSKTRSLAGIEVDTARYEQQGLVAVCATERSHQNTAWQCFTEQGPLAMLPLAEKLCSMVWSMTSAQAQHFMQMDSIEQERWITRPMRQHLGDIHLRSKVVAFELEGMQARQYVKGNVVLLGDAAHQVHPLAGQGLNLGLADVAAFARILANTQRPLGSARVLRKYERERKAENTLMQVSFEWIDRLFREQSGLFGVARSSGFGLLDKLPIAKRVLMRHAIGLPV